MNTVHIADAVRAPISCHNGALASDHPDGLAAHTIRALLDRAPDLDPALIEDVDLGNPDGVGEEGLRGTGREPRVRIGATGASATDPHHFGLAPVEAANRALARAAKEFDDPQVRELNAAPAAQVLGCLAEWPEFTPAVPNPRGGAGAPGHPFARRGSGTGAAALCIGVGQGLALVLER
ncbi:hypothetical protein GQF42_37365 [Streptomyces broussonetiae]|uniref:Thiolase C-terminal domain-containing protein n=1 Tax=Streptomyces broussonetiae TaxID=2686304 RepID=A0A6I6NJU9_9ACTN|nr:hypothetical protein GQF42_37365 [Streptomyces broussonetiae]